MLFSSIPFLYYFLPIVVLLYFIMPRRAKNAVLLISSIFFYWWGEPRYALLMVAVITASYLIGLAQEAARGKKWAKPLVILSAMVNLCLLGFFKYADFFIQTVNSLTGFSIPLLKIALPIGISFYIFQSLSYNIDVYRGTVSAQRNFISLAAYVSMFPQLIAGPIVRYSDIALQLGSRRHSIDKVALGVRRFAIGLAKKVLLANTLGELCAVFKASGEKSVVFFWLYAAAYALQIYFDFSGYSDMAIGLGKVLGFDFMENFNYPYISGSVTEFWRRWHISLGSWFRDYVYIPLGGNRVSKPRWFFNIFVVWALTGMWHGASWNFIIWGLFYAVLLVAEKLWLLEKLKKAKVLGHLYVLLTVIVGFIIFDSAGMKDTFTTIGSLFGLGGHPFISAETLYYLKSYAVILIMAAVGSTPLPGRLVQHMRKSKAGRVAANVLEPVLIAALLIITTAYLVDGSFNPFLYFRF